MNNSEILFVYDAHMCNPNGDPDEENRPRMDNPTQTNLVSDVRLKRYIRDYLQENGHELYVQKGEAGKTVNASERIQAALGQKKAAKLGDEDLQTLLNKLIDVRLFGATMPIKLEGKGQSIAFTGPVQFNWGYSLNRVYLLDTKSITSHFSSEAGKEQGTIGKDYRVKYSLIAFHGIISGYNAKNTGLKKEDVALLDQALVKAIPLHATRSKVGQEPRLYIRVEYNSDSFVLGDLRKWVKFSPQGTNKDDEVFSVQNVKLDITSLVEKLQEHKAKIQQVKFWKDGALSLVGALDALPNGSLLTF
ncbi:MAG: type I-B CRISPR-associated protein Cas7/Csh2 [candidate division KSB1 bacterium]|nr:type I-B CRISPR-associated protein Cas7/Csh2 [candidate division KSB1 bacterium]MDZ7274611.1 type I-B CRISPR-associated protein Cas7/Csh2 [candidate division KSB1 bacterium]MDZ7285436.1 type I-B CRISPR-associated protein Cas7/Csh2 [candidate division KSB1 bacterium]MDZ7298468.1 type I-B CRISPR-associated protein Cas7/Csh2 [candidate division KSB1 bacterium]MDZ7306952.1 type I-B CRISPR-associated protein Cas7/Csh2 [candidate division KSB1 bacterium]